MVLDEGEASSPGGWIWNLAGAERDRADRLSAIADEGYDAFGQRRQGWRSAGSNNPCFFHIWPEETLKRRTAAVPFPMPPRTSSPSSGSPGNWAALRGQPGFPGKTESRRSRMRAQSELEIAITRPGRAGGYEPRARYRWPRPGERRLADAHRCRSALAERPDGTMTVAACARLGRALNPHPRGRGSDCRGIFAEVSSPGSTVR